MVIGEVGLDCVGRLGRGGFVVLWCCWLVGAVLRGCCVVVVCLGVGMCCVRRRRLSYGWWGYGGCCGILRSMVLKQSLSNILSY